MRQRTKHFYEFGDFRLDATERVLLRNNELVPLTQKALDLLLALVERGNQLVEKNELMLKVWPDSFVEEGNLTQNIHILRKALGQTPGGDGYIRTVPRRGYCFTAPVREAREAIDEAGPEVKHVAASLPAPVNSPVQRGRWTLVSLFVFLAFAAGVAWYAVKQQKPAQTGDNFAKNMSVTALTTAGNVSCAAVSPDGQFVAYAAVDKPPQSSLWIEQLGGGRSVVVPASGVRYHALTFAPDKQHIYYVAEAEDAPVRTLYRVAVGGGPAQKILDNVQTAISFAPDGKQFVFRRTIDERRQAGLFVARADGGEEREVAAIKYPETFSDPVWSPDGHTIACAAGNPNKAAGMYVAAIDTASWTVRNVSTEKWQWVGQMAWLASSRGLLMVAKDRPGSLNQIWHLAYPGGGARRVTNDSNSYNRLSLAAGVMSALHVKQVSSVWIVPAHDSGRAKQITFGAGGYRGGISWMSDGRILYESETGSAPTISVMDADGGNARVIANEQTSRAESIGNPAVTIDNRYVVYASDVAGERHLWRRNIDGSNLVQLTDGGGEDFPHVSPDGQWVVFTKLERRGADKPTLGKVSINGGEIISLVDAFTSYPIVSPDGKFIACLHSDGPGTPYKIAVYSFDGGRPLKIYPQEVGAQIMRWTPDGRGLTYVQNPIAGAAKIWTQPLDGGEPRLIAEFENNRLFGLDWSPDGTKLICVRGLWAANVVVFKNFE